MLRQRVIQALRTRGGSSARWTSPGHQDRPNGYLFNRTPPPPGQSRKWEDWELPCYITSFLTILILGVGLNAKPDLTLETWAHHKALERLNADSSELNLTPTNVLGKPKRFTMLYNPTRKGIVYHLRIEH